MNTFNRFVVIGAVALTGISAMAVQPLKLPETVLQAKVDFAALGKEVVREAGAEVFAQWVASVDAQSKRSAEGKFVSPTNVVWAVVLLEYSPEMAARDQDEPALSFAVKFDKDVRFLREFMGADGHVHDKNLIRTEYFSYDDLYFDFVGERQLIGSSSAGLLGKWKRAYAQATGGAEGAILPAGCLARIETRPISSMLAEFGVKPLLLDSFKEFGDPELGASLASIGKLTLDLTSTPRELLLALEVASDNDETREIVGTLFSSLALSVRLGCDFLAACKEDLPYMPDRKVRDELVKYRALYQRAFKARHLPAAERLELRLDRARLVDSVTNALRRTVTSDAAAKRSMEGRSLFVALTQTNTEREAAGLVDVWPRTAQTRSEDSDDVSGQVFATSTAYFAELFDLKNEGKEGWAPYLSAKPSLALEGGRAKWIVIAGVGEGLGDNVPVLISPNVDCAALNEGRFVFSGDWAVAILKGGAARVIRDGTKERSFGRLPRGVRYLAP